MLRNKEIAIISVVLFILGVLTVFISYNINVLAGFVCFAGMTAVNAVFFWFTRKRYKDIASLSAYLNGLISGKMPVHGNTEGELGILKSDIYKLASRLTEQAATLQKEKTALQELLSDISHQLKTPLTSLSVMAELLQNENLPMGKRQEFCQNLINSISRMEWLILSLLKMAKIDSGSVSFMKEPVMVRDLFSSVEKYLGLVAEMKNVRLLWEGDDFTAVLCDRNWTLEAMSNITKNALEHSKEGGVVTIGCGENNLFSFITVSDSGKGIASEDLPHIFKRFYKSKHASPDSIGIGLHLSLAIMQRQNGDIEVKNLPEGGASFVLKLFK